MTTEIMNAVIAELKKRGIHAELEHPGVIYVENPPTGSRIIYGDANETIDGDVYPWGEDSDVIETLHSGIPSDSTDVLRIADWIACNYTEACGKAPEYQMPEPPAAERPKPWHGLGQRQIEAELDPHDAAGGPEALEAAISERLSLSPNVHELLDALAMLEDWIVNHFDRP